jgi:hypothetical protein
MNITFGDTFLKSLKRINMRNTWWYKTYDFFRYQIPTFFKNVWFFRKELLEFKGWDYNYNLDLFKRSLEKTANEMEFYGHEVEITRKKKVKKIKRVIEILNNISEYSYITMAEKELGEIKNYDVFFEPTLKGELYQIKSNESEEDKNHNRLVYDRAHEIENEEWNELWRILEGQNHDDYIALYDKQTEESKREKNLWDDWFDGSGMKHWWD